MVTVLEGSLMLISTSNVQRLVFICSSPFLITATPPGGNFTTLHSMQSPLSFVQIAVLIPSMAIESPYMTNVKVTVSDARSAPLPVPGVGTICLNSITMLCNASCSFLICCHLLFHMEEYIEEI